ncbi:MAG: phospho-N-acetylmuramoyl-pentapeptide-transferase, partial [Deltaproteobacteria bacterium]|nr:phospho-N-acetylmuramoyl-pentapeptide-transferase [Deltaproteobacteria bacterium]
MILMLIVTPWAIRKLRFYQIGQYIQDDGPASHKSKAGTPTMGGVIILFAVAVSTLLWANLEIYYIWVCLFVMLGLGAIGFLDDYRKLI